MPHGLEDQKAGHCWTATGTMTRACTVHVLIGKYWLIGQQSVSVLSPSAKTQKVADHLSLPTLAHIDSGFGLSSYSNAG